MLVTDARFPDHPIVYANDGFCRVTGYGPAEVLGGNCRFLQGPATDPETIAAIRVSIDAGEAIEADIVNYRKNGQAFWNQLLIEPVRDADGTLTHFVANQVDVTAERGGGSNCSIRMLL
jgi:PAS domain S-box-containing protein